MTESSQQASFEGEAKVLITIGVNFDDGDNRKKY